MHIGHIITMHTYTRLSIPISLFECYSKVLPAALGTCTHVQYILYVGCHVTQHKRSQAVMQLLSIVYVIRAGVLIWFCWVHSLDLACGSGDVVSSPYT